MSKQKRRQAEESRKIQELMNLNEKNGENEVDEIIEKKRKLMSPKTLNDIILSKKQLELIDVFDNNFITVVSGPAGTSKTFIECYYAIKLLKENTVEKIIFTKPIQEAGEKLGALPGTVEEKIDPHYESFRQNLLQFMPKTNLEKLIKNERIECKPLAYMRGTGFKNCLMILDEAQNCNWKQLMLFITRMGEGSKVIISGDISQYDIKKNMLALTHFSDMVKNINGVATFKFERNDIRRHPILIKITDEYEKLKYSDKIKEE